MCIVCSKRIYTCIELLNQMVSPLAVYILVYILVLEGYLFITCAYPVSRLVYKQYLGVYPCGEQMKGIVLWIGECTNRWGVSRGTRTMIKDELYKRTRCQFCFGFYLRFIISI